MLVILSGMESVSKASLARELTMKYNNFDKYEIDGYVVDITGDHFTITTKDGELVYGEGTNAILCKPEDGSYSEDGYATYDKVVAFKQMVLSTIDSFVYKIGFGDIGYDYGVTQEKLFLESYGGFLEKYQARPFETVVLVGAIAKGAVEQAISDLGQENVKVLSVIRNPSTSYLYTTIPPTEPDFREVNDSPISVKYATEEYVEGMLCAIKLKTLTGAETVRYEDLISTKTLSFDGKTFALPESFSSYNSWITQNEKNKTDSLYTTELDSLNSKLSAFNENLTNLDNQVASLFPANVFTELGYTPLTINNATSL